MRFLIRGFAATILVLAAGISAQAADITPSFAGAPAGWTVDRYAPNSFADIGPFMGASNALGIGISSADQFGNRPSGFNSTFYNTQGRSMAVSGGVGSSLGAYLWVPASWSDAANGSRRTDLWGVGVDGINAVTEYPIVGFTNFGGAARFRGWDTAIGAWTDFTAPVTYDAWNQVSFTFTGTTFEYNVNGTLAGTVNSNGNTTDLSRIIMQAYNFGGDPSIVGATPNDYTAVWAQGIPEPSTVFLLAFAFAGMVAARGASKHPRRAPGEPAAL